MNYSKETAVGGTTGVAADVSKEASGGRAAMTGWGHAGCLRC
jgi:hypothetical protein